MINQILRSSSSVGANFRAACRARSDSEFYSKICIVTEECDETQYWLNYLIAVGLLNKTETSDLTQEVLELLKIFTTMKKNSKKKLEAGR